jgi:hypothetical protein
MMSDKREALSRKLAEKQGALRELSDASSFFEGSAEVAGDWAKHIAGLSREISDIESELAALDGNA